MHTRGPSTARRSVTTVLLSTCTRTLPLACAFTTIFNDLHHYIVLQRSIATKPLQESDLQQLRHHLPAVASTDTKVLRNRTRGIVPFYTLHHLLYAARVTPDGRLVCATGAGVAYYANNRLHVGQHDAAYAQLEAALEWFYPFLKGRVSADVRWEGVIAATLNDFPCVGVHPKHRNVLYSLGYCGHGVSISNYSGRLLLDLLGKSTAVSWPGRGLASHVQGESQQRQQASTHLRSRAGKSIAGTTVSDRAKTAPSVEQLDMQAPAVATGLAGQLHFVNRRLFPPTVDGRLRFIVALLYLGLLRLLDTIENALCSRGRDGRTLQKRPV